MDFNQIKNKAVVYFMVFLALVIFYSLFFGPAKKWSDSFMPSRTFSVSAEGKVTVSPDIAITSFSVVTEGADTEKIADENNKKINEAVDFIVLQGVDKKDIKTTQYNLNPKYSYNKQTGQSFIYSYSLTQTVSIKIRDLAKIGKILSGLPKIGINQMGSISFDIDEPEKYLSEARTQAFEKARVKAENIAEANGVGLGNVISFYEYQSSPNFYRAESLGMGGNVSGAPVIPQIQPGTQEVTVQVTVNYAIR